VARKDIPTLNVENESVMKSTKHKGLDANAPAKRATSLSPKLTSHVTDVKRKDTTLMNVLRRTTRHNKHIAPPLTPNLQGPILMLKKWS
jgi:hypothetical protein